MRLPPTPPASTCGSVAMASPAPQRPRRGIGGRAGAANLGGCAPGCDLGASGREPDSTLAAPRMFQSLEQSGFGNVTAVFCNRQTVLALRPTLSLALPTEREG